MERQRVQVNDIEIGVILYDEPQVACEPQDADKQPSHGSQVKGLSRSISRENLAGPTTPVHSRGVPLRAPCEPPQPCSSDVTISPNLTPEDADKQPSLLWYGETLVLLHGFTGSAVNWVELFPQLATPSCRLIALDMLGHGQSSAPTDPARYTIEHCQADILAVLEKLGVRPGEAILLGYSMGGRIALYTAFSGFFRALILESASPGLADPVEREQRRLSDNALAGRIERVGVEAFIDDWEKLPLFASQSNLAREAQATLREQRLANRSIGLANSLRGVGTGVQPALHERLYDLNLPVLLLAGELDEKFCGIAREMAAHLPQARLQIVPGAGHTVHLEQPGRFVEHVHKFCNAVC